MINSLPLLVRKFKEDSKANPSEIDIKSLIKSIVSFKFIVMLILSAIFGIWAGYSLNVKQFHIKLILNVFFGSTIILMGYCSAVILALFLLCLTFRREKIKGFSQGVGALLSYIAKIIGAEYFISTVIIFLTFINITFLSLFFFSSETHFLLLIVSLLMLNSLFVSFSIETALLGHLVGNYVQFLSKFFFESIPKIQL